jgi:uncharacterized C2H2 Zn-finger protein
MRETSRRRAPQNTHRPRGPQDPSESELLTQAELDARPATAATVPAPAGFVYCPACLRLVRVRKDGALYHHAARVTGRRGSRGGAIPCVGAIPAPPTFRCPGCDAVLSYWAWDPAAWDHHRDTAQGCAYVDKLRAITVAHQ